MTMIQIKRPCRGSGGRLLVPGQVIKVTKHQASAYVARGEAQYCRKGGSTPPQATTHAIKAALITPPDPLQTIQDWQALGWNRARKAYREKYGTTPRSWVSLINSLLAKGVERGGEP
jgi:hypothetical protein